MNELEEKIIQYEQDSIAFETGKSKVAPTINISPNELLILLNEKNTEIDNLKSFAGTGWEKNHKLEKICEDARRIIQAFSDHDDYILRKTVMQCADEWLTNLEEEEMK